MDRRPSGFTLLEMLIVTVIVGILSTIAYWGVFEVLPKFRLETAFREMSMQLGLARAEAISKNRQMIVHFQATSYRVAHDADRDGTIDAGEVLRSETYGTKITYYRPVGDGVVDPLPLPAGDLVVFDSRGLATNIVPDGQRIGFSNGSRTREILIRYVGTSRKFL